MERIKEAFTGKSREERGVEHYQGLYHTNPNLDNAVGGGTSVADTRGTEYGGADYNTARGAEYGTAGYTGGADAYSGGVAGGPGYGSTTTTTTTTGVVGTGVEEGVARSTGREEVCGAEFFTKTEDRPVVKERVEYIQEHRPVEKEFVVETRATGVEREIPGGEREHLGTTERVVMVTPPKGACE